VARLERDRFDVAIRLATIGTLATAVWLPVSGLGGVGSLDSGRRLVPVLIATVIYGSLHFWHVWWAVRGVRSPYWGWTLAALAVTVFAFLPFVDSVWGRMLQVLGGSCLILLPLPWSFAAVAVIGAAIYPLGNALGFADRFWYVFMGYLLFAIGDGVLVYLTVALRRLKASRTELAEDAVVRERLRIDAELRGTIGTELAGIVARGERAGERATPEELRAELSGLADASRQTLTGVRQTVRGYQQVSLRAELDTAITLLAAGGVQTTVIGTDGPPVVVDDEMRATLRAGVATLLRDGGPARRCVIEVLWEDRPRLRITSATVSR
jgi:two-component system, NarL family, sensor histidine kinase DesK